MKTIEINEIGKIIENCPAQINLMFIGDTGIGKTTAIKDYANKNNYHLETLILSQLDASEALGIPIKTEIEFDGKKYPSLATAIPNWVFRLAENKRSILYLDEFFCADPSVMNSFLNFLSEKTISDINLSHVKVIASTNIGNYTFTPDTNMMSRFCMFYTKNTTYNNYIKDKRFINDYEDFEVYDDVVFDKRSLKPRCQEQLSYVSDEYLPYFYEGFTNSVYNNYHLITSISDITAPFVEKTKTGNIISDENVKTLCGILIKKYPRIKNWSKNIESFRNCDFNRDIMYEKLGAGNEKN